MDLTTNTFESFWLIYPRKQGKPLAETGFNKLTDAEKFNAIQATKFQIGNNPQWSNPAFIPMPATFINQKRWLDETVPIDKPATVRVQDNQTDSPAHLVWSAMTQMYGTSWITKHGEHPSPVWRQQLKDISLERLKRGLKRTLDAGSEFPPSLPTFIAACAKTFGEECDSNQVLLPKTVKTDDETAIKWLEQAYNITRGIHENTN